MSSICSSRFPIPCACRAIALSLVALALGSPAAAQRDEGVVDELARLLAAADTRVYDTALFREALRHPDPFVRDRKSTRLNSSHSQISYAVFCLKKTKTMC